MHIMSSGGDGVLEYHFIDEEGFCHNVCATDDSALAGFKLVPY